MALTQCMSWQEHYREAERLLAGVHDAFGKRDLNDGDRIIVEMARVHALLATVRVEPQITDHMLTQ